MKVRKNYSICVRCGKEKQTDIQLYCKPCRSEEYRRRRQNKKEKKVKVNEKDLTSFVNKIKANNLNCTLNDLNDIISFYNATTKRIYEFDHLPAGKQIQQMWVKISDRAS